MKKNQKTYFVLLSIAAVIGFIFAIYLTNKSTDDETLAGKNSQDHVPVPTPSPVLDYGEAEKEDENNERFERSEENFLEELDDHSSEPEAVDKEAEKKNEHNVKRRVNTQDEIYNNRSNLENTRTEFQSIFWESNSCFMDSPLVALFAVYIWILDTGRQAAKSNSFYEKYVQRMIHAYKRKDLKNEFRIITNEFHEEIWAMPQFEKGTQDDVIDAFEALIDPTDSNFQAEYCAKHECEGIEKMAVLSLGANQFVLSKQETSESVEESFRLRERDVRCQDCKTWIEKQPMKNAPLILNVRNIIHLKVFDYKNYESLSVKLLSGETVEYDLVCIGTRWLNGGHVMSDCKFHNDSNSFLQKHNLVSPSIKDLSVFHHGNLSTAGRFSMKGDSFSHIVFKSESESKPITFFMYVRKD